MAIKKIITRNGQTKWEVRFHLNGRESTRVNRRFDTKVEAETHFHLYQVEKRERPSKGPKPLERSTTFLAEAQHWLAVQGVQFSESHRQNVNNFLSKLLPRYGSLSPEEFNIGLLREMRNKLLADGLKPGTVNRHLQAVQAVLNFSVEEQRIARNPSVGFKKLKESRDGMLFWEQKEAQSFLSFAERKYPKGDSFRWVYLVYLTAMNTGARAGEIWGLSPRDLIQNGELILIRRQFNKVVKDFSPTKGKEERRVPCNPNLFRELSAWIQTRQIDSEKTIFQSRSRSPIDHDNFVKRYFTKDLTEWDGKKIRFHDLRHTAATLMVASGIDLKTVQEICGHEDIKTTMNYAHLLSDRIREAGQKFSLMPDVEPKFPAEEIPQKANLISVDFGGIRKLVDHRLTIHQP